MGRGATLNGNGRAVYPPVAAPVMTRYRQPLPERRKGRLVLRIGVWILVVALMLAAGFAGGTYLYVERDVAGALASRSFDVKQASRKLNAVVPGAPTNALVVGYDLRASGREAAQTRNGDTLMLLRADPDRDALSMLSFPRDLRVEVHCPQRRFMARINAAYAECGSRGALDTVRELTGLPIHYLVTVNFRAFRQIVANVGGVWIDVDHRYFNDVSGPTGAPLIDLKPGYQKLNGEKALGFVRYRQLDSDFYRVARQQMFVKALKQRVNEFSAFDLPKLVHAVTKNAEVGRADGDVNVREILGWALFAHQLPSGHFFQSRVDPNRLVGQFELTTDPAHIKEVVEAFVNPDVDAPEKASAVALNRKPRLVAGPPPAQVSVSVLNGNGRPGAAGNASAELGAKGYRIVTPPEGNAPSWDYPETEIHFDPRQDGSRPAAQRLARLFGEPRITPVEPIIRRLGAGAMLTVIVGKTFRGSLAPAPVDQTPTRQRPNVRADSSARDALRGLRRRFTFPLYAPTLVERTSTLARDYPVHVHPLGGENAVRLTFATGVSEYWGIQQTSWEEAPVLRDPNDVQTIGGRTYHLYFSGPRLHMVVLRTKAASYWVVNTVLDALSNETMLAIAKSLRPVRG